MHCPKCGQQQMSDETRFCSRCGFLLTGIADVVANHGIVRAPKSGLLGAPESKKRRGVKIGTFFFLMMIIAVPLAAIITLALNIEPFLPVISAILFGGGGVLRVIYALMFESGAPPAGSSWSGALPGGAEGERALPPQQSVPASAYTSPAAGSWRDTNDLQHEPASVTDHTTKLLENESRDQ